MAALAYVKDGMVVGLGTGSTSRHFHEALGAAVREGRLRDIKGVPTSEWAADFAQQQGIPLTTLAQHAQPDVTVDGADEIDPQLNLIKGLGGALLREKIVAASSRRMIVIADASKVVGRLGTTQPLPVEVTAFGHETHVAFFRALGGEPTLRQNKTKGGIYVTDNANYIYDVRFPAAIPDAAGLEAALRKRPGIVETGLFIDIASVALIADDDRVEERVRQ
jgi:ribose 5-phosphate isomerase A